MKKNPNIQYLVGFVTIFLLPAIFFLWVSRDARHTFDETLQENRDVCISTAERENLPTELCTQAASQARETFSSATSTIWPLASILLGVNFGLFCGILGLRRQLAELKEKIDA
jgi:hypothetical protein